VPVRVWRFKSSLQQFYFVTIQRNKVRTEYGLTCFAPTVTLTVTLSKVAGGGDMERPKRPYSIFKRPTVKKNTFTYYVRFRDHNGGYLPAVSSGKSSRSEAANWADRQITEGKVASSRSIMVDYVTTFWDWEQSSYIQGKLVRGKRISKTYANNCFYILRKHFLPAFSEKKIGEITTQQIEDWILRLYRKGDISATSINHLLKAIKVMFAEAFRLDLIGRNPAKPIEKLAETPKRRQRLSPDEAAMLFAPGAIEEIWYGDATAYLMNLIAAVTGMRQGEIRGLLRKHVHRDCIEVAQAWEDGFGLKDPKWGSFRIIPIPEHVADLIYQMTDANSTDALVFRGTTPDKPLNKKAINSRFYQALHNIGITEEQRKERNISFHSWRYFFNTACRISQVPDSQLRRITGHRSIEMTERYTDFHMEDFREIRIAQSQIFNNTLADSRALRQIS
jgi:integrase